MITDLMGHSVGIPAGPVIVVSGATLMSANAQTLQITDQSDDYYATDGDTATFVVAATGSGLTYRWEYSDTDGAYWGDSSAQGATTNILQIRFADFRIGYMYRCIVNYDAWGKILTTTGDLAETLGEINPLRYRGYVYDSETQFYYLQSRYYDPERGRFLNADAYVSTGQGVLGNNMFAYCGNDCVNMYDPDGRCSRFLGFLWLVDCGQPTCETSKSNPNREPCSFEKFLTHMARPREEGNTFSVGFSGGYSGVGVTAGKSVVLSVDTSHNYAFQETTTSGAASGIGGSAGLVLTYTNATNVQDLRGDSESTGFTFVSIGGMSIDYVTFSPYSNPDATCWGISVVISAGGEFEGHTAQNYTTSTESWNPFWALRDRLYGG